MEATSRNMRFPCDELEKKTGIDFYPNLSKLIGKEAAAKVEAQDPKTINWWW